VCAQFAQRAELHGAQVAALQVQLSFEVEQAVRDIALQAPPPSTRTCSPSKPIATYLTS